MGFLKKLFGSKQAAPSCEVHPDDKDLVRPEDWAWWNSLSFDDVLALEEGDKPFQLALYTKFQQKDGLDREAAAKKVRLAMPYYYLKPSGRDDDRFYSDPNDKMLPYVLKNRINRAVANSLVDKQAMLVATSANAYFRQAIRSGRI